MALGELAGHLHGPLSSALLDQFFEQLQQAVRRFIENAGALFLGNGRQALLPLAPFGRQKTFKAKAPAGQAAAHQGCGGGARTGNANHRVSSGAGCCHKLFAGIADAWQAGITDQGQGFAIG